MRSITELLITPCSGEMLSNGESLNVVQETLGHSQASMTLDVYGHVLPNHQKQAMSRLGELLS